MSRVEIKSMPWGNLWDTVTGAAITGQSATLKNLDGTNATTWSAVTAGSSSTSTLTSDGNGNLPRYVEGGQYLMDVPILGITDRRVEAVSGSVERSSVSRLPLAQGKQSIADLIDAEAMADPPTLTWAGTGGSFAGVMASYTQLTSPVLVRWDDPRVKCLGGSPTAYTSAGYSDNVGAVTVPDIADPESRYKVLSLYAADVVGSEFSLLFYGNNTQYYRIWIDGQPHTATPVVFPYNDGVLRTLNVSDLPRGRDRYTVMVELEAGLFGGFIHEIADSVLPPSGIATGPAALIVGDSYTIGEGIRSASAWPMRLARRQGIDRVYVSGFGGTGVLANSSGTGLNYMDRLVADRAQIPDDLNEIVLQGSTNDVNEGHSAAAIEAEALLLLDYCAAQWPDAQVVLTSTLRCKDPSANDLTGSGAFQAAAAQRSDVLYVDQIAEEWFSGTGTEAAPTGDGNADYLIQSDASHPTALGQAEIADRLAAAIALGSQLPAQVASRAPVAAQVPRVRARYGGAQNITTGSSTEAMLFNSSTHDVGDMWEGVTNPTRITFPQAGVYRFGGATQLAASAGGTQRLLTVRLNGTTNIRRAGAPKDAAAATYLQVVGEYEFAAGDYIEILVFQDSGGTLATGGVVQNEAWASLVA